MFLLIQNFRAWLHYTRHFRRIGERVAGKYYNENRHAIKREIRSHVTAVLSGFDVACQKQHFSSKVAGIAENSRRIELCGKCAKQAMAS